MNVPRSWQYEKFFLYFLSFNLLRVDKVSKDNIQPKLKHINPEVFIICLVYEDALPSRLPAMFSLKAQKVMSV